MNIQTMLYVYLFICASMIVFNIVNAIVLKRSDNRTVHVDDSFYKKVLKQIESVKKGERLKLSHRRYMKRKLSRIGNMIGFDEILEKLSAEDPECITKYLMQLESVFMYMIQKYGNNDRIEAAFFPYIIQKYHVIEDRRFSLIINSLLGLLSDPNIYCRENAMQALYTTGDTDTVLTAIRLLDGSELFFHDKLLSDGLLKFRGDHAELGERIMEEFSAYSNGMKVALLNFMRFDSDRYSGFALELLKNTATDSEVRYACIRYLGKYRYDAAYKYLQYLADSDNGLNWEYSAIASSAIANYPGEETVRLLKRNLSSRNWYIRFNSSRSLEQLGLGYLDLIDIMEGNDRFAREILRYRFDVQRISGREEKTIV